MRQIGHDGSRPMVPVVVGDNLRPTRWEGIFDFPSRHAPGDWVGLTDLKVTNRAPATVLDVVRARNAGTPTGGDPQGDGVPVVVRGRESRPHGEGGQVSEIATRKGMRNADNRYRADYRQGMRVRCDGPSPVKLTGEPDALKGASPVVRSEKADVLSGSQTRRGKSRSPVAWMAGRRETECPEAHRRGHLRDGRRVTGP